MAVLRQAHVAGLTGLCTAGVLCSVGEVCSFNMVSTPQGNVSFNPNGIRNAERISIQQYRFNSSKYLGQHYIIITMVTSPW